MSRVEVTDLIPGELAESADVNATLTSWVSGTATGSIDGTNVSLEGVDRRTMSATAHVVFTDVSGPFTRVITSSGAVSNVTGSYVEVPGPLETDNLTFNDSAKLIVHATLYMESGPTSVPLTVELILEESDNNGGVWADFGGYQAYEMRAVGVLSDPTGVIPFPAIATSATFAVSDVIGPTFPKTRKYRVGYKTTGPNTITFLSGTIFVETFQY